MKYDTIIFDLDGTLLNTLDDIMDSMNYALKECGYPLRERNEIRRFIGGGPKVIVSKSVPEGLSKEETEHCQSVFLDYYVKHSNDKTDLYPGMKELVHTLAEAGCRLGVVSSKGDGPVKDLIFGYFGEDIGIAIGQRDDLRKKPAPDSVLKAIEVLGSTVERSIYVGDSEVDVETARNTGIPCVIVTWGFRDREELEALEPDYLVDTKEQLEAILMEK